jgi:hypothetical protein
VIFFNHHSSRFGSFSRGVWPLRLPINLEQESADLGSLALRKHFLHHLRGRFLCFAQFDYSRCHSVLLTMLTTKGIAILMVAGLLLTALGAGIAAKGVIISYADATAIATTKWALSTELRDSLISQSRYAMWGLILVVLGTLLQAISAAVPLFDRSWRHWSVATAI